MPKGKEEEMPPVLGEDVDIAAAEKLRDVVANIASASNSVRHGRTASILLRVCSFLWPSSSSRPLGSNEMVTPRILSYL